MQHNNVFTIAKRNVEGQDMLYQSLKLTNNVWVLNELKIQPGNPDVTVIIIFLIIYSWSLFSQYNEIIVLILFIVSAFIKITFCGSRWWSFPSL